MIPAPAAAVCDTFLDAVPRGLVTGLYLRGGLGFGEWVAGQSDVDFVATLARRPDVTEVEALRAAHETVAAAHPGIFFDGCHLQVDDLAADPGHCPDVPCVLQRAFEPAVQVHDATVAWHELARCGIRVHGPGIEELGVWTDADRLVAFTRGNLDSYWRSGARGGPRRRRQ